MKLQDDTNKILELPNMVLIYKMKEKHKLSETRQYRIWEQMKQRCTNLKSPNYKNYGGRGIKISKSWLNSFNAFWKDMNKGYNDNLTLDRINNDGNYSKSNCRWATRHEQSKNNRRNIKVTVNGKEMILSDAAKVLGLKRTTLQMRLSKYGWTMEEALNTKVYGKR